MKELTRVFNAADFIGRPVAVVHKMKVKTFAKITKAARFLCVRYIIAKTSQLCHTNLRLLHEEFIMGDFCFELAGDR